MLSPSLRFSELTNGYNADDNVVFHLKKLIDQGYIKKESNVYKLTVEGVKKTNEYDWKNLVELGSKPLFVGFIVECNDMYLIKKHDQADTQFYNLPNGKPYHDKDIRDELVRLSKQEMNIEAEKVDFNFDSFHIKNIVTSENKLLFSDAFVVYKLKVNEISKVPENLLLLHKSEIVKLSNRWIEIDYCILRKNWENYLEYTQTSNYIL